MLDLALRTETPKTAAEVVELVAEGRPLEIVGGGTKRGIGRVSGAEAVLSLAGLSKVIDYAPEELVLTAQAGVKLSALEKLVAAQGQMLPFEPPHLARLLGAPLSGKGGSPTLGGALAANLSGPRRIRAGAARDHFLGLEAVTGRGELMRAGGKVVKNVTGYDLPKLMAGSWGTLAVLTEVTIKVLPAPRSELTLLFFGLDDARAGEAMTRSLNLAVEVSAAAHLPAATAARPPLKGEMAVTALRLEGFAASVAARADHLAASLKDLGRVEQLDGQFSRDFWLQVREVEAFWKDPRRLWRISVPPACGWQVGAAVAGEVLYDWGGGLVWLLSDADPRPAVRALGGHATLYRGEGVAFEPLEGPLAALTARVKAAFDPNGVLNSPPDGALMQTLFTPAQLADPDTAASHAEIRKCVHCGFCTATCPTYVLLGDERDSPRGRIELIKAMLEDGGPPPKETVTHVDRCLSCLACVTACPSGVDYAQLIDHGRAHIEAHYRRPLPERFLRWAIPHVMTRPRHLRGALAFGRLARPLEPVLVALKLAPLAALLRLVPKASRAAKAQASYPAEGASRGRVVLLQGCVEPAMALSIRAAAIRLITRAGFEVVLAEGEGCCGALSEHLGRADEARGFAAANVRAWTRAGPFDAIVTTAAGCGTTLKAYGHRLDGDPDAVAAASRVRDVLEFIAQAGLPPVTRPGKLAVAYHAPCSLQHGQKIKDGPAALLAEAGFEVRTIAEGHLCCGSAGVYNILQPQLATRLRDRKAANIAKTGAAIVAAGNVGCIAQLAPAVAMPVIHPVELLDWATGGPRPAGLDH